MGLPRMMIAAASSGSGKTLATCGILRALVNRGIKVTSFKCGPDYIDPMFHSRITGRKAINLDTFFTDENTTKYLFARRAESSDVSVIEGVMGYYDGLAGISTKASSYDLARILGVPVILVINCKGLSMSAAAVAKGFKEYREDSNIKGVLLNQMPKSLYEEIKTVIEKEVQVKVLGYIPKVDELVIESRHLGLVTPDEIEGLNTKLNRLASLLEETVDMDALIALSKNAGDLSYTPPVVKKINGTLRIAAAMDEAFCFYYEDNLQLLRDMGADIIPFSPIKDSELPECDGLILGGGYPELYARPLHENGEMRKSIYKAVTGGLPCLAECGGYMYLHEEMEDIEGKSHEMAGVIKGRSYRTNSLKRFGYITLTANFDQMVAKKGEQISGHEFHYFDSTVSGEGFHAKKPLRKSNWNCMVADGHLAVGYPHLYYYSNTNMAYTFLEKCREIKTSGCN